jgi:ABC-type molybdate transport system permease subunit
MPAKTYYLFNKKYKVAKTNVAIILSLDPLVLIPTVTGLYTQNATYKIVYFLETFYD